MDEHILLAIKPEFVAKMFDNKKTYEFRKKIFRYSENTRILIYASRPVKKVLGEFKVEDVISDIPEKLWEKTHPYSGINKLYFDEYFSGKNIGYAIKIRDLKKYDIPLNLSFYNIKRPPQSFMYLRNL